MFYQEMDGSVHFYSRTDFPRIDKPRHAPHIVKRYAGLDGTIIDGELLLPFNLHLGNITGIMNMLPENAHKAQAETPLIYAAFDILFLRGVDVSKRPYTERRALLEQTVAEMGNPHVYVTPYATFDDIVGAGGEGVVLKNVGSSYGIGWVKMKKRSDVSCVITGFKPGEGKCANMAGAIYLSVYQGDKLVEVGKAGTGMDDATRSWLWARREALLGTVADVFTMELTKDGRMRSCVFHRLREDVKPETCTMEKLRDDVRKARKTTTKK